MPNVSYLASFIVVVIQYTVAKTQCLAMLLCRTMHAVAAVVVVTVVAVCWLSLMPSFD